MKLFYSICLCLFLFSCGTPNDSIEDVRVNEVEVTLNGGGFDNATYKLGSSPNTRLNGATYLPSYGITNCIVTEEVAGYIDENLVSFSFDGNDTGDYSFVEPTTNSFRLLLSISEDSVLDFSPVRDETGGFLRVTRYPDVGEQIEGSFSLEGIDVRTYDVNKKIKVNGTFKIMRGSDVDNYNLQPGKSLTSIRATGSYFNWGLGVPLVSGVACLNFLAVYLLMCRVVIPSTIMYLASSSLQ